jgi:ankyrin repeat protein
VTDGSEYQKHIRAHMPGTGNWIFETEQYKKWFESEETQTLWIKGVPGSKNRACYPPNIALQTLTLNIGGKSVMAANLIKKLSEDSKSTVLFFFFRNIVEVNSKPISLVRDFLAQLLPNSHQLVSIMKRLMLKFPDVESTPIHELWGALITTLSTIERAFIVVDALDEIDVSHKSFIPDTLLTLGLPEYKSVNLVVTSRPLSIFERPSENSYTAVLRLSLTVMDQDISTYISQRLESQQQRELGYDEKNAIMNHVFQQQHRLFLQTRVMLDDLLQREEPVESLLGQPAHSMSHMYQNILHEYSIRAGVLRELQVQVLQWVTHTSRPLRLLELSELLCSQGLFPDIHKAKAVVRICCGPLLEVLDNETISIIHHSFTELLLDSSRLTDNSPEGFPVLSPTTTHAILATACIDYALKAFESYDNTTIWSRDQRKKDHMLQFPFLQYAVHQWPYHFSKASDTETELLQQAELFKKLDILLESEGKHRKTWLEFCTDGLRKGLIGGAAIHIASFLGLTRYVEYLLQRGIDPNLKASDESTPITCAASQGHARVIAVIVKYGGNVDAVDCFGLTPLHHAAIYDRATAITTLADCGANLLPRKTNADRGQMINHTYHDPFPRQEVQRVSALWGTSPQQNTLLGHTPIEFACEYGCSSSVAVLMRYMTTEQRATVCLHWAAARGHSEIISILLQYPEVVCRINEIDENGNTALILASRDINPDVVHVLLQAGASISPVSSSLKERDSYIQLGQKRRRTNVTIGITPLNAWAELSQNMSPRDESALLDDMEKVAGILVQAGCDVDVRSAEGYTPLFNWNKNFQSASVTTKFVSILLDHGADPRAKAECGSTLLHLMNGKEQEHEAILLLIKAGADINAVRTSDGKTPMLNYASIAHDVPDLTRFIQYGIDFSKTDNDGNTVLHYLMKKSSSNHPIRAWFDVCDPRVINKLGETCLFSVCHQWPGWGVEKVINEVISRGVNLETKNLLGRTALLETCCEGGNEHIKAFLTVGADTAARDNHGSTCKSLENIRQSQH